MAVPLYLIRKLLDATWQHLKLDEKRFPKNELEKYLHSIPTATLELEHSTAFPSMVTKMLSQAKETGLSFTSFSIYLLNRRSQQITHYLLHPPPVGWATLSLSEVPVEDRVYTTRQPEMWKETGSDKLLWHLAMPSTLGVAKITDEREKGFSPIDQRRLEQLAGLLEMLVVRHRDLHRLEMLNAKVFQVGADLTAIHDGSYDLAGKTQDEVAQKIIHTVTTRLSLDRAGIFLRDPEKDILCGRWGVDEKGKLVPISGTVFELYPKQPETLTEAAQIARGELNYFLTQDLDGEGRKSTEGDIRASVAVPMRVGNRITGVIAADNYFTHRPIHEHQVQPLMILANQGAGALEHAKLYEELRESEQRYQTLVEHAPEAIVVFDADTDRFVEANENAVRLFGLERTALFQVGPVDMSPPNQPNGCLSSEVAQEKIQRALAGDTLVFEWMHRTAAGEDLCCEKRLVRLPAAGRHLVRASITDITERKRAEEEKAILEKQLRQAQKMEAIGQLTAGIAHNFNNALQTITGNLELTLLEIPESFKSPLRDAKGASYRAAEMIQQLMLFSRQGRSEHQTVTIQTVIDTTVDMCRKMFDRRINIDAEALDTLPGILGNAGQLQQVFLNLCLNARDALDGLDRPSPRITLVADTLHMDTDPLKVSPQVRPGWYTRVRVTDNGVGMDDETKSHVFEPFFTTKESGKGTGLGLSTVFAIVRDHQGWVECESDLGAGTAFSVYLPATEQETAPEKGEEIDSRPGGTETILVIDDEEMVRDTLARCLKRGGYTVVMGEDGKDGLEVFQRERNKIALVLLDLSMPRMSGPEVLVKLRAIDPQVKVVIMGGYIADKTAYPDAQAILQKPIRLQELLQMVRTVLDA